MNSRAITVFLVLTLVALLSLILGQWAATDPTYALGGIALLVACFVIFGLGRYIWLLLPFFYSWTGTVPVAPGNFSPRDLAVLAVVPILLCYWVVRRFHTTWRFGALELALLIQFVMIGQSYARNPAGLALFGTASVGARPYFEMGIALLGFVVLATQVVDGKKCNLAIKALFAGTISLAILETLGGFFPRIAMLAAPIYVTLGAAGFSAAAPSTVGSQGSQRLIFLRGFADPIITALLSARSPLQTINPLRIIPFAMLCLGFILILLSGFRSGIIWIGMMMVAAALIRRRGWEILIMSGIGVPMLAVLILGQGKLFELPFAAQRALSFLPGDWDREAAGDAEGSTKWRLDMWKLALTTDRYISNKFIGDGFSFSSMELKYHQSLGDRTIAPEEMQDYYMITGGFHSGPVETIRRVGYLGLFLLLVGMTIFAKNAAQLIRSSQGTPYYFASMYIGLPIIILPWFFTLVFGSYTTAIIQLCFAGGLMRMLENSLAVHLAQARVEQDQNQEQTRGSRIPAGRVRPMIAGR